MINSITAYFNTGLLPVISCVNRSTVPIGPYSFDKLIATLQKYNDECFSPIWGTPCKLIVSDVVKKGTWGMVFLNDADAANALGYHDLTKDGFPLSKIFTKTTIQSGEKVSVTASHELVEMLIDPAIQMIASDPKGLMYAYEVADAVEAEEFLLDGIPMSNFQYPSWFEGFRKPNSTQFDYMKTCKKPFQINRGGYMSIFQNGRWSQIFAKAERNAALRFKMEEHPRAVRRAKHTPLQKLKKSKAE